MYNEYVSNIFKQLKDKELMDVINPEAEKGRTYKLASTGEDSE